MIKYGELDETIRPLRYRDLWPLALLLLAELAGLLLVGLPGLLPISRLSGLVAGVILTCALLLPLLQPTRSTRLVGTMLLLLAGLLVVPFELTTLVLPAESLAEAVWRAGGLSSVPGYLLLRLLNGLALFPVGVHLSSRFPERSPDHYAPGQRLITAVYLLTILFFLLFLFIPQGWLRLLLLPAAVVWLTGLMVYATILQIRISRDADPTHRRAAQQARLVLLTFWLAETPLALRLPLFLFGASLVPYNLILLAQLILPLGLIYAVRQHDLFGIDVAVRRALGYALVLTVVVGLYMGLTLLMLFGLTQIGPAYRPGLVLLLVLLLAAIFQPLYRQVVRAAERIIYPERAKFVTGVRQVQQALSQVRTRADIEALLTQTLPAVIDAAGASLSLSPAPQVPGPDLPAPSWNAPLLAGSRQLGRFWLGARRSGVPYNGAELAALGNITDQAALALAYAQVVAELNELNQALEQQVAARTAQILDQQRALAAAEERQRLAQDLHDTVTQTLFSISLSARAWRKMADSDPGGVAAGLREQEVAAQQALKEMRELLTQLRRPLTEEAQPQDIVQALRRHSLQLEQQNGLHVVLETPETLFLPARLVQELLAVVREALHNVIRHSGVKSAGCRLWSEADRLHLRVVDGGVGFDPETYADLPPNRGHHLGLQGMQQRLATLGGELVIHSRPGQGVRLQARVPWEGRSGPADQ